MKIYLDIMTICRQVLFRRSSLKCVHLTSKGTLLAKGTKLSSNFQYCKNTLNVNFFTSIYIHLVNIDTFVLDNQK